MDVLLEALKEAVRLLATGDPYLLQIIGRSLQVSGAAVLLGIVVGVPLGNWRGLARFLRRRSGGLLARRNRCALGLVVGVTFLACSPGPREIVLASTTSTDDSGLFEFLLPAFQATHSEYRIRVIAVGSGEALRLARRRDADVVLAHSPRQEREFMVAGHGESRQRVMYNDFVIVGSQDDAAGVRGLSDAPTALRAIAGARARFVSRGDDSGTHSRERELWATAGIRPGGEWYLESGLGMGEALMMASEKVAYTLADRGTYLSLQDRLDLVVLVEGDPVMRNEYSVIVVRDAASLEGARRLSDWITSPAAQALIGQFGVERFGRSLFTPSADQI